RSGRAAWSVWRTGKPYWKSNFSTPYSVSNANYIPAKLTTCVFCVICEESRNRPIYSPKPWTNLAPEVRCEYVSGTHLSCIREHVGEVARALDAFFCNTEGFKKTPMAAHASPSEPQRDRKKNRSATRCRYTAGD